MIGGEQPVHVNLRLFQIMQNDTVAETVGCHEAEYSLSRKIHKYSQAEKYNKMYTVTANMYGT